MQVARRYLSGLHSRGLISDELFDGFMQLRDLRDAVAHGRHNPTVGEALLNAKSAVELRSRADVTVRELGERVGAGTGHLAG